jgi:hypothetical protein
VTALTAKRLLIAALPLALLAACDQGAPSDDSRSASGEVLEGTISDAMLPLDTVRSQAPLAPIEVASGKPGKAKEGGAAAEEDASEGAEPATTESAAPAASPSNGAAAEQ